VHEAGFYSSDAEFLALIVPFVTGGIAAGEPVVIGYDDRKRDLLRTELTGPTRSASSPTRACTPRQRAPSRPTGSCSSGT
jgi:hypothetical protein